MCIRIRYYDYLYKTTRITIIMNEGEIAAYVIIAIFVCVVACALNIKKK